MVKELVWMGHVYAILDSKAICANSSDVPMTALGMESVIRTLANVNAMQPGKEAHVKSQSVQEHLQIVVATEFVWKEASVSAMSIGMARNVISKNVPKDATCMARVTMEHANVTLAILDLIVP